MVTSKVNIFAVAIVPSRKLFIQVLDGAYSGLCGFVGSSKRKELARVKLRAACHGRPPRNSQRPGVPIQACRTVGIAVHRGQMPTAFRKDEMQQMFPSTM
jgi:hypothetical protein